MTKGILVPLDGTPLAKQALPWAQLFADGLHADVELVRVVDRDSVLAIGSPTFSRDELIERATEDAKASLMVAQAEITSGRVETTVGQGSVPEFIAERAAAQGDVSLVVMTSHAKSEAAETFMGSVASSVVAWSGVPVLVIRPGLPKPETIPQRILVPQDGSDAARAILPTVTNFAKQLNWILVLLRVVDLPPPVLSVQGASIPLGPAPDEPPADSLVELEQLGRELQESGVRVETRVGWGARDQAICSAAVESACGLIALSTHGRHGLQRLLLGSVSEGVIRHATMPVLTLRPSQQ